MFEVLDAVTAALRDLLSSFDPRLVTAADAVGLVERLASIERLAAAGRTVAAGRAAEGTAWTSGGHATPQAWLAAATGTTTADAAAALRTAASLAGCPSTAQALRAGELSPAQAAALTTAVSADHTAERRLLEQARTSDLHTLRGACRQVEAAARAEETEAAQARIHAERSCRTWTDHEGAVCGRFRLTAAAGARVLAALDTHHQRVFTTARTTGRRVRAEAIHADALVAMADASLAGDQVGPGAPVTIVCRVDQAALDRGHTVAGEESSIDGVGPVPVTTVRSCWSRAVLAALSVDGGRVVDLRLAGRAMPRRLRLAVIARDRHCVATGCGHTRHLEIHHLHPVAEGGPTALDNLAALCHWHHDQVTHCAASLTRHPDGTFTYTPLHPDVPDHGPFDDPAPD